LTNLHARGTFVSENEFQEVNLPESENGWSLDLSLAEAGRFKDYQKRHEREHASCFVNLGTLLEMLDRYGSPKGFGLGFFRSEGRGVYRIGQTGVKHAKETRLYVYPSDVLRLVYVLTIGTKESQKDDVARCWRAAEEIRRMEKR
jgi:hypothetical protein